MFQVTFRVKLFLLISQYYFDSSVWINPTSQLNRNDKVYFGVAEKSFKDRFYSHTKSFAHEEYANDTELSNEYWEIKRNNFIPKVLGWFIFVALLENNTSWACFQGSKLNYIFYLYAHSEILVRLLFKISADVLGSLTTWNIEISSAKILQLISVFQINHCCE